MPGAVDDIENPCRADTALRGGAWPIARLRASGYKRPPNPIETEAED
jgi:hypothetical protein